mgnify:CR=1 FL=1
MVNDTRKRRNFSMMVKLTQDLARGFKPWKDMFHENEATLNALGAKLVFAGTEKEDDNKLTIINTKFIFSIN